MTPEDLIRFVLLERDQAEDEERLKGLLSLEALVDRGDAILGLRPAKDLATGVVMRCAENVSRLRIGDRVRLTSDGGATFQATILDIQDNGESLSLRTAKSTDDLDSGPWSATSTRVDLSSTLIDALEKLGPGAPGWNFFQILSGETVVVRDWWIGDDQELDELVERMSHESGVTLDDSQRATVIRCLRQPTLLGVQGPPGTGKTVVLSFVAEGLARLGKRVLIVAPTHQAVNNALTTTHHLFPTRPVTKVGSDLRRESLHENVQSRKLASIGVDQAATIVGMTFLSAVFQLVVATSSLSPHVVIVDEAGQLPLAQGALAGRIGAGSLLLFGDDMQMPPVVPGELADTPLAVSVFGRLRAQAPRHVTTLNRTYRLNEALCRLISDAFYRTTGIEPAPSAALRVFPDLISGSDAFVSAVLQPDAPIVWVDTSGHFARQENPAEARAITDIVSHCIQAGMSVKDMAVVTPYRREAVLIRNMVQSRLEIDVLPIIDTVERVQGLTVELILVSMCATDPEYLAANAGFLYSPNRLNVSVSRARTKAIVFAPRPSVSDIPDEYAGLTAMQTYGQVLDRSLQLTLPIGA